MAKHTEDDMLIRHTAAWPTNNSTNSSGTNQNGTSRNGTSRNGTSNGIGSNGIAPNGTSPLAMQNDNAFSQSFMNGLGRGRPSMNDRPNPMMRASDAANQSRAPGGSSPWQQSWSNTRSGTRENSRTRGEILRLGFEPLLTCAENSSLGNRTNNESSKGSKALLPDTDLWNDSPASSQPPIRSVRTSPVRRDSNFSVQDTGNVSNTSQNMFGGRSGYQRPANGPSDPQGQRYSDGAINALGHQTRLSDENLQIRGSSIAWSNPPPALQSPTDGNNGRASSFASRNGSRDFSLPPSRSGSDYQDADMGRFSQASALHRPRNDLPPISALSNGYGKSPSERNDLQQSDLTSLLAQMSISNSRNGLNHGRSHSSARSPQEPYSQSSKNLANVRDEVALNNGNGVAMFQSAAHNVFQNTPQQQQQSDPRFGLRGIYPPLSNEFLQDSHTSNPRAGHTYQDPATLELLQVQQQLHLLQQQQLAASRYRNPYATNQPTRMNPQQQPYQYPVMPMSSVSMQPGMMMPVQPGMMMQPAYPYGSSETPMGPRPVDDTHVSSPLLQEFKNTQRSNARRWEFKACVNPSL